AFGLLDLELILEEAEALDAVLAALHLERVEGVALVHSELATDHLVAGRGVAGDVDTLDIDARSLADLDREIHDVLVGVAIVGRVDVGKGVAEVAGGLVEVRHRILDGLGVEPAAGLEIGDLEDRGIGEVAQGAVRLNGAQFVPRTLLDDVGDDEIAPVGRQLREGRDDAEVSIAFGQVKGAQLLLVGGKPIGVIGVVGLEEAQRTARLPGKHLLAQAPVGIFLVADDVDGADLGEVALVDLEHDVDAVLVELDDFRLDASGKTALPPIELENPIHIGASGRAGEDLARRQMDLGKDLVVLEALVALEDDAVDDRILAHRDHQVASVGTGD